MKKVFIFIMCFVLLAGSIPMAFAENAGTAYYIDSVSGDDSASGKSPEKAWKTVENLRTLQLNAGDEILFKTDGIFNVDTLTLTCEGTKENPIVLASYGEGGKPLLTTQGKNDILHLFDCSYVTVKDLEMTAHNGGGIWIDTTFRTSDGITLDNLTIHNIQNDIVMHSRDNLAAGPSAARACLMVKGLPDRSRFAVNNLTVTNCEMYDCGNGISLWGSWNEEHSPWCTDPKDVDPLFNENTLVKGCYFHDMDAEAIIVGICENALVTDCRCINCCQGEGKKPDGKEEYFNAAMWFWGSNNSTIQNCEIAGQKNFGDGMTCDFDSYTQNCTYQYIYSHDNTRFVCNCPNLDGQYYNTIRYCLSVNDNVGRNRLGSDSGEYYLRFYNNTIINSSEFFITGVRDGLIANNIITGNLLTTFYWEQAVKDPETGKKYVDKFTGSFTNNCLYGTSRPACAKNTIIGAPGFVGDDLDDINSFKLSEKSKLVGAGIKLDGEETLDFYGNPVTSNNIGCFGSEGVAQKKVFKPFEFMLKMCTHVLATIYQTVSDLINRTFA